MIQRYNNVILCLRCSIFTISIWEGGATKSLLSNNASTGRQVVGARHGIGKAEPCGAKTCSLHMTFRISTLAAIVF